MSGCDEDKQGRIEIETLSLRSLLLCVLSFALPRWVKLCATNLTNI